MPERIDNNLGQLKFEHNVNEAFFISNKTYVLKTKVGKEIKKAKGAVKYSIPYSYFQYLYLHSKSIKANKTFSTINYSKGSVTIETKEIDINWDSYTKREKLYDPKTKLWTDTRPLYIDNLTSPKGEYYCLHRRRHRCRHRCRRRRRQT
jgi:hypothetical protein